MEEIYETDETSDSFVPEIIQEEEIPDDIFVAKEDSEELTGLDLVMKDDEGGEVLYGPDLLFHDEDGGLEHLMDTEGLDYFNPPDSKELYGFDELLNQTWPKKND